MIQLPGLIDTHVHLREPGATQKEDFETGTKAAIAGGYTVVLDMPNNPETTTSLKALNKKIRLAGEDRDFTDHQSEKTPGKRAKIEHPSRIYCDVGFHFGASPDSIAHFQAVRKKVFGLKIYMNHTTGTLLIEDKKILEEIFSSWPSHKVIMVHAEGETLEKAIRLARKFKKRLHVCHLSLKDQIEMVKKTKLSNMDITCEVTAHHLFLTREDVKRLGPFGMMRPPLATKTDQGALWNGIKDGTVDTIASDHAPHTKEEKQNIPTPNGIPGLETTLPLLLNAVSEKRLTMDDIIRLCHTNPARIFNIPIQKDTYTEIDPNNRYSINDKHLFTKCKWTPFKGMGVKGKVKRVILRGQTIFENGEFKTGPIGKVIYPAS